MRRLHERYILLEALMRTAGPMSIAELVAVLEARDDAVVGPIPNKWVSDLLRAELSRGRVVRILRGRYGLGIIPGSTARRIRRKVQR